MFKSRSYLEELVPMTLDKNLISLGVLLLLCSFASAGSIAGHVADSGSYLAGALATATSFSDGSTYTATSETNGFFNVTGLPDGNYNFSVSASGYHEFVQSFNDPGAVPFINNSDPSRTDRYFNPLYYNFTLTQVNPSTLQGFVLTPGGELLGGVILSLYSGESLVHQTHIASGDYQIGGLTGASYDVVITPPAGYLPTSTTVYMTPGATTYQNFTLYPVLTETISGHVYNASDDSTVEGALVEARVGSVVALTTHSLADGSYSLSLPVGLYNLTASAEGFREYTVTQVHTGAVVDLLLPPPLPVLHVVSLVLYPQDVSLDSGSTQQFLAIAYYSDGTIVSGIPASWSVSGVGSVSETGLYSAGEAGAATVTATFEGVSNSSSFTVSVGPFVRYLIEPNSLTTAQGNDETFVAFRSDAWGNRIAQASSQELSWAVTNGVGTISSDGFFRAVNKGNGLVTATNNDNSSITGSASVRVVYRNGGSGGGGGQLGGGSDVITKSELGGPCSFSSDCLYGECIDGICQIPSIEQPPDNSVEGNGTLEVVQDRVRILMPSNAEVNASVTLTVIYDVGGVVEGAEITVTAPDGSSEQYFTGEDGSFSFRPALQGAYSVYSDQYIIVGPNSFRAVVVPAPVKLPEQTPELGTGNLTDVSGPSDSSLFAALRDRAGLFFASLLSGTPLACGSAVLFVALIAALFFFVIGKKGDDEEEASGAGAGSGSDGLDAISFTPVASAQPVPPREPIAIDPTTIGLSMGSSEVDSLTRDLEDRLDRLRRRKSDLSEEG